MLREKENFIKDILDKIKRIENVTKDKDFTEFKKNKDMQEVILYNLIVIGEASSVLRKKFDYKNDELLFFLKENRNKLTHQYWFSREKKQWEVLKSGLPELKEKLKLEVKNK